MDINEIRKNITINQSSMRSELPFRKPHGDDKNHYNPKLSQVFRMPHVHRARRNIMMEQSSAPCSSLKHWDQKSLMPKGKDGTEDQPEGI